MKAGKAVFIINRYPPSASLSAGPAGKVSLILQGFLTLNNFITLFSGGSIFLVN